MHIIIDEIDRRIHFHSFGQQPVARPGGRLEPWWAGTGAWQTRRFLDRYFRDAGRLHVLRHALTRDGHDGFDLTQRSDDEVLQAATRRVASGIWRIACEVASGGVVRPRAVAATSPLLGGGAGGDRGRARMARPPMPSASRAAGPAPATASSATAVAPDWPNTAEQVAQAQTLVRAAKDGTPFCEICEAHRRAAEKAAA
jgi:hypothetical protein